MRLLVLGLTSLLWIAPGLAQADEVPVPQPRPAAAAGDDAAETTPTPASQDATETAQPAAPGRVIKITIIGEKKPGDVPPAVDSRGKQAELQRQRLLEARRARLQQERARRVGGAVRPSEPFRRAGSPRDGARSPN